MDVESGSESVLLSVVGVERPRTARVRRIVSVCAAVDGVLLLAFVLSVLYIWMWRRRRTRRFLTASPQARSLGQYWRSHERVPDPGTSWQFGRAMSKQQLEYVKENCLVDMKDDLEDEDNPCAICLDLFEAQSPRSVLRLDCKHVFHETCMSHWIVESHGGASCPLCKEAIPVAV